MRASNFIRINEKGNIKDSYKVGNLLKNGNFGEVRKVKRKDNPEEWRVLNTMNKTAMGEEEKQKMINEINVRK